MTDLVTVPPPTGVGLMPSVGDGLELSAARIDDVCFEIKVTKSGTDSD